MSGITVLGKNVVYQDTGYNPSVLVRQERSSNRVNYNIDEDNLPFTGVDT